MALATSHQTWSQIKNELKNIKTTSQNFRKDLDKETLFQFNKTYIAGDDDQAIFRWAGADVDSFIAQTGKIMQLTQSYRIPQVVHDIASKIVTRIQNRLPKE